MSLYDDDMVTDLPGVTSNTDQPQAIDNNSAWANGNFKLMQMQVEAAKKRQSLTKNKPAFVPKSVNSIAPVIDLSDKRGKPQLQLKKDPEQYGPVYPSNQMPPVSAISTTKSTGEIRFDTITGKMERVDEVQSASIFSNSTEEYDPMRPNEYEKLVGESQWNKSNKENDKNDGSRRDRRRSGSRSRRKHSRSRSRGRKDRRRNLSRYSSDESRSRSRSRRKSRSRDKKSSRRRHSSSSDDSDGYNRKRRHDDRNGSSGPKKSESEAATGGAKRAMNAFAPPPVLLEDTTDLNEEKKAEPALPSKSLFGSLKAEKMMAKMGYKEGDGLGRNKQGMSIALQVEKTGKRIGRIIHEKDVVELPPQEPLPPVAQVASMAPPAVGISADAMKNMSKVILLTNMVGPGDVDDELEAETKEECAKYGEVNKCLIFELPSRSPEEAVRIFLEFKTLPSAIKALTDLNGRFFGGRAVKATFYNLDKFKRLELDD